MRPGNLIYCLGLVAVELLLLFLFKDEFSCAVGIEKYNSSVLHSYPYKHQNTSNVCMWEFVSYQSSLWEKEWLDNKEEWDKAPCSRYNMDDNQHKAQKWVDFVAANAKLGNSFYPPVHLDILSSYTFKNCEGNYKEVFIEPLTLITRHPFFCADPNTYVVNKDYMFVDWTLAEQVHSQKGRVYYFDCGASLFNSGGGGASQSWFVELMETRGLTIDGIYAWEAITHDANKVFADIPGKYWPIYHWYNIPASSEVGSHANPLTFLKKVARPNDLVIFKLDIDTPVVEAALTDQILSDPEISSLIDVFFYEFHVSVPEMASYWGGGLKFTQVDSVNVFTKLRQLGIRAHSWV